MANQSQVSQYFKYQKTYSGGGPNVNSEFYTTWFSLWGDRQTVKTDISGVLRTLNFMNELNASFSFYMIHGGSNFGFWSGAESVGPVRIFIFYQKVLNHWRKNFKMSKKVSGGKNIVRRQKVHK